MLNKIYPTSLLISPHALSFFNFFRRQAKWASGSSKTRKFLLKATVKLQNQDKIKFNLI